MEEFFGAVAEISKGGGDFLVAAQTKESDNGVAEGSQVVRAAPLFHLALVFAKGDVTHPMQAILDAPVPTPMVEKKRRIGQPSWKAADGVLDFDRGAAFATGCAFQPTNL
jgi:hypothetical protein